MKQVHVLISGFVRGIGFRSFVRSNAQHLGLTGWVKNLPNGWVEAVFEGEEEKIKEMIEICRQGPPMAEVERLETEWSNATGEFLGFEIRL